MENVRGGRRTTATLLATGLGLAPAATYAQDPLLLIDEPGFEVRLHLQAGVNVVDAPFAAHGNVATAGGCLASQYLAAWMIARLATQRDAEEAIRYVAPVGEKAEYVQRAMAAVTPFLHVGEIRAA